MSLCIIYPILKDVCCEMHVSCHLVSAVIGDTMRLIKVIKLIPCLLQCDTLQKYCDKSALTLKVLNTWAVKRLRSYYNSLCDIYKNLYKNYIITNLFYI